MDDPRKSLIPLDYSSPVLEDYRAEQGEIERQRALEDYNEATYGDAHPYSFWRFLIFISGVVAIGLLLPRWALDPVIYVGLFCYLAWDCRSRLD